MSMTRAAATLLLIQIVMVCPMLLTPVTYMSGADKTPLYNQVRAQFHANKERVLKILEEREWYRSFLEMLKRELAEKGDDQHLIRAAKISMHLLDPPRIRRSVTDETAETDRWIVRQIRSVPTQEHSKVEVSAALKVDGKVCLNVTKNTEAIRMGDSNEIIKADIGNTEILLSMRFTKKDADVASIEESATEPPRPPAPPPPLPPVPLGGGASARTESPPRPPPEPPATTPRTPASGGQNESGKAGWQGDYSEVLTECADQNYCLFGGKCQYYAIINMQLCSCRKGYKGNRCELYDIHEVLSTLDSAHKRHVIGNGPIKQEDHVDVLSVVESTALYLMHVPNSYPSEQALQLMESILRH